MAKKQRKSRNYSQLFANPAPDLPSPEEVNKKVAKVTGIPEEKKETPVLPSQQVQSPVEVGEKVPEANIDVKATETPPGEIQSPAPLPLTTEAATLRDTREEIPGKRGRKPLEVKRVPYTTSITEDHKFRLKYHAMRTGLRPSDMLNLILEQYFKSHEL